MNMTAGSSARPHLKSAHAERENHEDYARTAGDILGHRECDGDVHRRLRVAVAAGERPDDIRYEQHHELVGAVGVESVECHDDSLLVQCRAGVESPVVKEGVMPRA